MSRREIIGNDFAVNVPVNLPQKYIGNHFLNPASFVLAPTKQTRALVGGMILKKMLDVYNDDYVSSSESSSSEESDDSDDSESSKHHHKKSSKRNGSVSKKASDGLAKFQTRLKKLKKEFPNHSHASLVMMAKK